MNRSATLYFALLLALLVPFALMAEDGRFAPDRAEPGSAEAITELTSDPALVSPWVAYLPDSETVTSPTEYLGYIPGTEGELTHSGTIYGYMRELARTSPRVEVEVLGETEEGREILLVIVADETGIEDLDELKAATAALADPRETDPYEAEQLITQARPIYYINAAIHGDESGSPEMAMELVYRLAVSDLPLIQRIREELVVLINPVSNPDGRDKVADWFYRFLKGRTDYDSLPRQSPPYWGRYLFVDANRDAHQQTQAIVQAVYKMYFDYHPTVVHDLHEAMFLLQTWNGTGPYNPNLEPIVTAEFLEMAFHEVTTMTAMGMPGVWTWDFGEGYGHHYLDSVGMNHNSIGRGYETMGNATAETMMRAVSENEASRKWFRPLPVEGTLRWSMRDNVNYQQTALLAILDFTAKHADDMLLNFYRKGFNSWQKGVAGSPYAFVIPEDQGDRHRVAQMVNVLLRQGIEVSRAIQAFTVDEGTFAAGSYVVPLDQPYRNYAVDLLELQDFPFDPEKLPYDDVTWNLPTHYGVETVRIDDHRIVPVELTPIEDEVIVEGTVTGSGPVYLLSDRGQEGLLAARYLLADFDLDIAEASFSAGGEEYPAGSWILAGQEGLSDALQTVARELALDFESAAGVPDVSRHEADVPRLGIWVPWADTDSIGWVRYTLDQRGVPYTYLRDEDIRAGNLQDKVDVIVYGNVDLELTSQIHGIQSVTGPMPFTKTADFPSHGEPASSEDITGGIGWTGLANLQSFVEQGGLLLTLGNGSALTLDGGMIRNVRRAQGTGISTPGAELRTSFLQPDHPIAYGYSETPSVFRFNYSVYDLPRHWLRMAYCTSCLDGDVDRSSVVLQWGADAQPMVVSGGAKGEDALHGRPAILAVPTGKGAIVAYNFNPLHRYLNHSDHRFLWNAILNWQQLVSPEM
jgi:hypothetical protein